MHDPGEHPGGHHTRAPAHGPPGVVPRPGQGGRHFGAAYPDSRRRRAPGDPRRSHGCSTECAIRALTVVGPSSGTAYSTVASMPVVVTRNGTTGKPRPVGCL